MSILDGVLGRLGFERKADTRPLPQWLTASAMPDRQTIPTATTAERQAILYANLTWIQIAIWHLSNLVATTALAVKRLKGEDEEDVPNHDFETLLRKPNPLQSRFELLKALASFYATSGNAYLWLNRPAPTVAPLELWVIPSQRIEPIPDGKMFVAGYKYMPGYGEPIILPTWSVCHFKEFNPLSMFVGLSRLVALSTVASGDLAMQRFNTNYFDKDNAKIPGALAFADPIDNNTWEILERDLAAQWGGTKRSGPLMLRGVGKGGVEWLQMAFNQKEMEFLESRRFNKEEIFAAFAPGLSSVLDVNATEANAVAGKATLIDFGVWPTLVMMAEKLTNDVMPIYGSDLICEFDDIRITDRIMDAAEQEAYERTHTLAETRKEYYGDKPLGDERDDLLIAEIGKGMTGSAQSPISPMGTPETGAALPTQTSPTPVVAQDAQATTAKAQADLVRWERKCINAIEHDKAPASVKFVSEFIPAPMYQHVERGLKAADTVEAVSAVFTGARRMGYKAAPINMDALFLDAYQRYERAINA